MVLPPMEPVEHMEKVYTSETSTPVQGKGKRFLTTRDAAAEGTNLLTIHVLYFALSSLINRVKRMALHKLCPLESRLVSDGANYCE